MRRRPVIGTTPRIDQALWEAEGAPLSPREDGLAGVARGVAEFFLDPQELVVFGEAVERARLPVLICPQLVATARSAMVASSVSPDRWDMTAV